METRANYILIGLFTLSVIAASFAFVYWFSQSGVGGERVAYRVLFEGAVNGLRTGSSVMFNGIKVGEVVDLRTNPQDPRQVVTTFAVDRSTPIRSDTKVGLEFQGLTGIASMALRGGRPDAPIIVSQRGEIPTLVADPNATYDVMQSVREAANRADLIMRRVDGLIAENEEPLRNTIRNIDKFTETLGKNSARFDNILSGLETVVSPDSKGVVWEISEAARSVRNLADNLDKRTAELSASLAKFTGSGLRNFEALAVDGRRTLAEIERAVKNFDRNPQRVIFGGGNGVPQYSGQR